MQPAGSVPGALSSEVGLRVHWVLESTGLWCSRERREDHGLGEHRCHHNNRTTTQVNISTQAEAHISEYSHKWTCISECFCVCSPNLSRSQSKALESLEFIPQQGEAVTTANFDNIRRYLIKVQVNVLLPCLCHDRCLEQLYNRNVQIVQI